MPQMLNIITAIIASLATVTATAQCDATKELYLSQACCPGEQTKPMCHAEDFTTDLVRNGVDGLEGRMFHLLNPTPGQPAFPIVAFEFISPWALRRYSPTTNMTNLDPNNFFFIPNPTKSDWKDATKALPDLVFKMADHVSKDAQSQIEFSGSVGSVGKFSNGCDGAIAGCFDTLGWLASRIDGSNLIVKKDTMIVDGKIDNWYGDTVFAEVTDSA